jgi:hypothetical protein
MSTTSPAGHLDFRNPNFASCEELFRRLDAAAYDFRNVDAVVEYLPDLRYAETKEHVCELLKQPGVTLLARPDTQWAENYDESTRINAEAEHYAMPLCDWVPPARSDLGSIGCRTYCSKGIGDYLEDERGKPDYCSDVWGCSIIGPTDERVEQAVQRPVELLIPAAARLALGSSASLWRWLIYLANRDEPLVRDSRRLCLDWKNAALPLTPKWGPAWVSIAGMEPAPEWWVARLPNVFLLTRLAVERAISHASTSPTPPADAQPLPSPEVDSSSGSKTRSGGRRVPRAEANVLVRDWLQKHGKADPEKVTLRAVAEATGVSTGGVAKTSAWKVFEEERKKRRRGALRTVPLSEGILRNKGDDTEDSPPENAIQREDEETWQAILQKAESSTKRADLLQLSDGDRQKLIEACRQQREDEEGDRRGRDRRERSRRS